MVALRGARRVVGCLLTSAAVLLVAPACDNSEDDQPPPAANAAAGPAAPGGPSVLEKQGVRVAAPAGQVLRSLDVLADPPPPVNQNHVLVSPYVLVRGDHWGFVKPVELTIPIDKSRLPQRTEASAVMCVLADGGSYEPLDPSAYSIDLEKGQATVRLTRLMPLVAAQTTGPAGAPTSAPAPAGPGVAVVANANPMETLDASPELQIQAPQNLHATAQPIVSLIQTAVTQVGESYQKMGFAKVPKVRVQVVPLASNIGAQASGGNLIEVNANVTWTTNLPPVIAHEYFHLVQQVSIAANLTKSGFDDTPGEIHPNETAWLTEGGADFMANRLNPTNAAALPLKIKHSFGYQPLTLYETLDVPGWPHQYQASIFFAYLNTRADAVQVLREVYGVLGGS